MSQNQDRPGQGRRRRGKKPKASDLWRPVPPLPPPAPIQPASDPTVVVRSLGTPPLKGQGERASQNLVLAADKIAEVATEVIARPLGLMAPPDDDDH